MKKDLLVTSAMQGLVLYEGALRAVHFLKQDVELRTAIRNVATIEVGTPLLLDSPALTQASCVLTIEMIFDRFVRRPPAGNGKRGSSSSQSECVRCHP
jgi:hypothetical protein